MPKIYIIFQASAGSVSLSMTGDERHSQEVSNTNWVRCKRKMAGSVRIRSRPSNRRLVRMQNLSTSELIGKLNLIQSQIGQRSAWFGQSWTRAIMRDHDWEERFGARSDPRRTERTFFFSTVLTCRRSDEGTSHHNSGSHHVHFMAFFFVVGRKQQTRLRTCGVCVC